MHPATTSPGWMWAPFSSHTHSEVRCHVSQPALRPTSRPTASMPVADHDVVRRGLALAGLDQLLEAHQVDRPLGAAVVHELHGLLPAFVPEQHDREAVLLL